MEGGRRRRGAGKESQRVGLHGLFSCSGACFFYAFAVALLARWSVALHVSVGRVRLFASTCGIFRCTT